MAAAIQAFDDLPDITDDFKSDDEDDDVPEGIPVKTSKPAGKTTFTKPEVRTSIPVPTTGVADPARSPLLAKPAEEANRVIDCSGVKPGSSLTHKTFGNGKVVSISDGKIIVVFGKAEKCSFSRMPFRMAS